MSSLAKLRICSKSFTLIFEGRVCRMSAAVAGGVSASCPASNGPEGGADLAAKGGLAGLAGVCCAEGAFCSFRAADELGALCSEADIGVSDRGGVRPRFCVGAWVASCVRGVSLWYAYEAWLGGCPNNEFTASSTTDMAPSSLAYWSAQVRAVSV